MAMMARLQEYLDSNHTDYTHSIHPVAHTAREVARAEEVPAHRIAKTIVFLSKQGGYGMAVLPGDCAVDLEELRTVLGFSHVRLATEIEIAHLFPDAELGAMPPFGNLYNLPVYLDSALLDEEVIAFNAGTHRDVVHMQRAEFARLVRPAIIHFSRRV